MKYSEEHEWFMKHSDELSKKYPGKYFTIIGSIIEGIGDTASEAFKLAKEKGPDKKVSIAYVPTIEETITLL